LSKKETIPQVIQKAIYDQKMIGIQIFTTCDHHLSHNDDRDSNPYDSSWNCHPALIESLRRSSCEDLLFETILTAFQDVVLQFEDGFEKEIFIRGASKRLDEKRIAIVKLLGVESKRARLIPSAQIFDDPNQGGCLDSRCGVVLIQQTLGEENWNSARASLVSSPFRSRAQHQPHQKKLVEKCQSEKPGNSSNGPETGACYLCQRSEEKSCRCEEKRREELPMRREAKRRAADAMRREELPMRREAKRRELFTKIHG
jgi:hypothetical protein